jgi:hypothetical protein
MNLRFRLTLLCLLVAVSSSYGVARATLGEPAETVAKDTKAFSGVARKAVDRSNYRLQEIASGTTSTMIREYVSASGVVFAVAWNGLVHPDLKVLLGSYHGDYQKALARQPRQPGRRGLIVTSNRLVVETWGHMRNLQGRAYLPALLPEGVNVDEIR